MTTAESYEHPEFLALLRGVLERPEDDAPRLIVADWLEDHGLEEWAGFIRSQILTLNEAIPWHDAFNRYLQEPMWSDIARGSAFWPDHVRWDRGFLGQVRLTCKQFMKYAKDLFSRHPITDIALIDAVIHASLGNPTYYLGGLGFFPSKYWKRLESHRSQYAVIEATQKVCVDYGRELAGLPPLS